eukprot:469483_1
MYTTSSLRIQSSRITKEISIKHNERPGWSHFNQISRHSDPPRYSGSDLPSGRCDHESLMSRSPCAEMEWQLETAELFERKKAELQRAMSSHSQQTISSREARQRARVVKVRLEVEARAQKQKREEARRRRAEEYQAEIERIQQARTERERDNQEWWAGQMLRALENQAEVTCKEMRGLHKDIVRGRAALSDSRGGVSDSGSLDHLERVGDNISPPVSSEENTEVLEQELQSKCDALNREKTELSDLEKHIENRSEALCTTLSRAITDAEREIRSLRKQKTNLKTRGNALEQRVMKDLQQLQDAREGKFKRFRYKERKKDWIPPGYGKITHNESEISEDSEFANVP